MLTIKRMRMSMPQTFQGREGHIGRLVAQKLAAVPMKADMNIERLRVPAVRVHPAFSDEQVASRIAEAVLDQIRSREE